mgnify:CR=1 FL=1
MIVAVIVIAPIINWILNATCSIPICSRDTVDVSITLSVLIVSNAAT